jgi:hypothetical protein
MTTESVIIQQTLTTTEVTVTLAALDEELQGQRTLLIQHKRNVLKLQNKQAIYVAGEAPLHLNNQLTEEAKRIDQIKVLLRDHFYRKLLYLVSLAVLSADEIRLLYCQCRPKHFAKSGQPATDGQLVHWIWGMRDSQDNETPILEFVERLTRLPRPLSLDALRAWRQDMLDLGLLTIHPAAMDKLAERMNSAEEQNKDSALLVEIAPDPGANDYLVRMYYWEEGAVVACWHKQENDASGHYNRTYKLHEIPNLLHRVLSTHEEKPAAIEFLLPKELLVEPVDQWVSDDDLVKFCSEHRIVIRSQERIAKRELSKWRQAWHEKWQLFQTLKDERDIWWIEPLGAHEATTLAQRLILAKAKATCIGLTFPPVHRANEQERTSLLLHILRAGVPIMAWMRHRAEAELTSQHVRDELGVILCKEHLDNLPLIVHHLRTCPEVLDSAEHIGNRLALFWDDPDRVPDVYK